LQLRKQAKQRLVAKASQHGDYRDTIVFLTVEIAHSYFSPAQGES